jgi:type II secretory pathway pseudopilin PulG
MSSYTRIGVVIMIALASITMIGTTIVQQHVLSATTQTYKQSFTQRKAAPIATSGGNNVYIAWWNNKTGNDEVMFKASTDGGKTFSGKMNLSNTPKSESQDVQIAAAGNNVYVSWWERNQTSNEPVLRVSNDNGKSFGERIKLSSNSTANP